MKSLKYGIYLFGIIVFGAVGYKGVSVVEKNLDRATSYISVNGVSDKFIISDLAKWNIFVTNETDSLKDIQDKRKLDKAAVVNLLLQLGFTDSEIRDGTTSIVNQLKDMKADQGKKKYVVTDTVAVNSQNVALVEKSISEVSKLIDEGIYAEGSVSYHNKNLDKIRVEMIEEATKDAQNRAENIAKSSNITLLKLKNISTGSFSIFAEDTSPATEYAGWSEGESTARKRIRVVVHATFNVKN
jgi:hypothetical protein